MAKVIEAAQQPTLYDMDVAFGNALYELIDSPGKTDYQAITKGTEHLCLMAQKDMNWKKALASPESAQVITAFNKERDALLDSVLELIPRDHPQYDEWRKQAISGRYLLDKRRSDELKARGVKQGFKENKITADGIGFNYRSNVVRFYSMRMAFFRPNRGELRCYSR